jgi:cobalt-zinc-cadmium resistance protein CzcA
VIICAITNVNAQQSISFQSAIDSAVLNNIQLKNQRFYSDYQKEMILTAKALTPTNVVGEFGRLNSKYIDNRVSFTQSFDFPTVYTRKKEYFQQEWLKSVAQVALKQKELTSEVAISYFTYINLNEKLNLLQKSDSIYGAYLQKAELRIRAGESSILEKITIENQRIQISNQLKQLKNALHFEELHFNFLLNTKSKYLPLMKDKKVNVMGKIDPTLIHLHPKMKVIEAEVQSAASQVKLEKSKLYPSFSIGVISGTMYGFGADNIFYTHTSRFTAGQIGLSLPLFSKQGSVIKASKINAVITQNNAASEKHRLVNQLESVLNQFQTQQQIVEEFEIKALPNATLIFETAQKQFVNGEIDYLQWAMLINQSISIQNEYQDTLMKYNELAIEILNLLQ